MTEESLCFQEAVFAWEEGKITLEKYLDHIIAHYRGVQHDADAAYRKEYLERNIFAETVREITIKGNFVALNDTKILYDLFLNVYLGNFAIAEGIASNTKTPGNYFLRPLATLACTVGSYRLVRFCFDRMPSLIDDMFISRAIRDRPVVDPQMLDLLFEVDFEHWQTKSISRSMGDAVRWGPEATCWFLDHGATPLGASSLSDPLPSVEVVKILLERFGINWFRASGFLQYAAEKQDMDILRLLVEAGADVNDRAKTWTDGRDSWGPPEYALSGAIFSRRKEALNYLLDHGARVTRRKLDYYKTCTKFKEMVDLVEAKAIIEEPDN